MEKIGFIGFGNMASAIAKGIIKNNNEVISIAAYDPNDSFINEFSDTVTKYDNAFKLVQENRYIFLCVKPQMLEVALKPIAATFTKEHVIVSILAGVTISAINEIVKDICPVIRTMPNTPLLLGYGTTAIARPESISEVDYTFVKKVFKSVGEVYEISPDRFNEIIPVNGSSPAFIYLFAKIIAEQAHSYGLDYKQCLEMISKTLIGSAMMILETEKSVDELIAMVSSKGGTTVAAIEAMNRHGFTEALSEGIKACIERAYSLGG